MICFFSILKYERLQDQERDLLRQMYDLQIELPQLPPPPPPVPITIEVKQPVERIENRKGLFEDLQRRNLRLERERFGKYLITREKYVYQILYFFS